MDEEDRLRVVDGDADPVQVKQYYALNDSSLYRLYSLHNCTLRNIMNKPVKSGI